MRYVWPTICVLIVTTSTASGFSGAEFLSTNRDFASGYAWGVLEYRISVGDEQSFDNMQRVHDCFKQAAIDSDSFYTAVKAYFSNNLSALTQPAVGGILRASIEMCPWED